MRVWLSLLLAACLWLPLVHLLFTPELPEYYRAAGVAPKVRELARRQLDRWRTTEQRQQELQRMRSGNAEWDFMSRTFLVLSLANLGLREPAAAPGFLSVMDAVICDTLALEGDRGQNYFLLEYAREGRFVATSGRSLFLDGEIAIMLGARCLLADRPEYRPLLRERVEMLVRQMKQSPLLSGESYPDECWTFCNSVALAAIRIGDVLEGTDHDDFLADWVKIARLRLTEKRTGLLNAAYSFSGQRVSGPEGSTLWLAAHCLQLVDPEFASDQYRRARKELGRDLLGFGYAREWTAAWKGAPDVDSGVVIPGLGASAGSSGLALVGAAAFGDEEYLEQLLASLQLAAFPEEKDGRLRFRASNQVGDAVILYALVQGPLWELVRSRRKPRKVAV